MPAPILVQIPAFVTLCCPFSKEIMRDGEEQVKEAANKRLREAETLLSTCDTTLAPFGDGAIKLANLIRKETGNLQTVR